MHDNHSFRRLRGFALAALLASTAAPAIGGTSAVTANDNSSSGGDTGSAAAQTTPQKGESDQTIYVTAPPLFPDIQPERELDPDAIESYGVSTVDELLNEVQEELGAEDELPLIFVNGKQINDISEIGALPVEAVRSLQVLPRGSAVRAGGSPGQRVISINLKRNVQSATVTAAHKVSTDGNWNADRGELILTKVHGQTRANIAFRARDESSLLESQRGIIQPQPFFPFALSGNIIGFPDTTGEIDPLLSALAGKSVTVAAVPPTGSPTLADLVGGANIPAMTNVGQFRTLRPHGRYYDLNGSFTTDLSSWLTASATIRLDENKTNGLRGLPSLLLVVPATNVSTPFSREVALAFFALDPLRYGTTHKGADGNLTLNGTFGSWTGNLHGEHTQSKDVYDNDRQTTSLVVIDDGIDPFTTPISALVGITNSRTTSNSIVNLAELSMTGPTFRLPAGPVQTTIDGRLASETLHSQSNFGNFGSGDFHRGEAAIRGAIDLPIADAGSNVLAPLGQADATAEYTLTHFSDAGTLKHYALGLNWHPSGRLQLGTNLIHTELPPSIQLLGNPATVTQGVRVFDPLTGDTVDVVLVTGGNPSLNPETDRIFRLNGLYRLVPRLNLQLNAEYTDTRRSDFVSALPEASAAVMLAFPDRFIRDPDGQLITEDLRPVNFEAEREKRLRWGISMNTRLGHAPVPGKPGTYGPRTYFQLTANHTMVFSDDILIRSGLSPVDLLSGGAIGVSGGKLRHQIDASAQVTAGGTGARIALTWRGPSTLDSRINGATDTLHFSPVLAMNLRAFTDLKRVFPHERWARSFRVSLDVLNVTNYRQRVRDSFGTTPLQYQPAYRDPLGRTVELELRKVF